MSRHRLFSTAVIVSLFMGGSVMNPFSLSLSPSLSHAEQPKPEMPQPKPVVNLIFDTDLGNDIDDAMALATIHALENRGECKLLAVTVTKDNPDAAPAIDAINTFYGRGNIPIGVVKGGVTPEDSAYAKHLARCKDGDVFRFPHDLIDGGDAPEATGLLREVLAAQPDGSVVILQVGFSTNLARLLDSKPDDVSPLSGRDLVAKKVRLLSVMAGKFDQPKDVNNFGEYNIEKDLPAAKKVFSEWPTPIVASGWEIGDACRVKAASIVQDYDYVPHHPIKEGYLIYCKMPHDRPLFDLTSVLYAVRPDRGYFTVSEPGTITIDDDAFSRFDAKADGAHRFLSVTPVQREVVAEALSVLSSEPPKK